jgi:hypothetical protein
VDRRFTRLCTEEQAVSQVAVWAISRDAFTRFNELLDLLLETPSIRHLRIAGVDPR